MACIWWGVQAWLGGQCVYVFLRCLFPSIATMKNTMSPATETTSAYVLSFVIYWIISLPTIWVPIHKLRWFFAAKAVIGPAVGLSLFGWWISRAGGMGSVFSQPGQLSGSALGWQMIISISSCFNNMFTLITNAPDFASRAKTPGAAVWPQIFALPLGFIFTSFLGELPGPYLPRVFLLCYDSSSFPGIGIASASQPLFGKQIWDIVANMDAMLDLDPSTKSRVGLAFICRM
jgi:NCS1 family nucleobase:cation symporter-1